MKELGFSYIEKNASDMRSKRSLNEALGAAVCSRSLSDFLGELFTLDTFQCLWCILCVDCNMYCLHVSCIVRSLSISVWMIETEVLWNKFLMD